MSFWFPDNVERRDRSMQLSNDITVMQQSVVEAKAAMDKMDARMVPFLNDILKNHNMATFSELQAKLNASLTPEQREKYEAMRKRSEEISTGVDNAFMGISAVVLISGVLAKTIDIGNFLRTGHVLITFKDYAKAFITIFTKGYQAGKAAFSAASKSAKLAGEILEDGSKLAKYAARAARVLKVIALLGVVADAVLLAYAYFAEKEQRDKLRSAINELYVRRIVSKFYTRLCDAIKTQDGMMISYLIMVSDAGTIDPDDQRAADKIANKMVTYIQTDWRGVDSQSSLNLLLELDHRRNSWMNEDPKYNDAIAAADELKDSTSASATATASAIAPAVMAYAPGTYGAPMDTAAPAASLFEKAGHGMNDEEIEAEIQALDKEFEDLLPPYTEVDYSDDLGDIPGQLHKMVDTDHFDKAAIKLLFA